MIARVAKRLEGIISISFVEPFVFDNGWAFAKPTRLGRTATSTSSTPRPTRCLRATRPCQSCGTRNPHDRQTTSRAISSGCSTRVRRHHERVDGLLPEALSREIDEISDRLYETVKQRRVSRGLCNESVGVRNRLQQLFRVTDWLEDRCNGSGTWWGARHGGRLAVVSTLVRFDAVYYGTSSATCAHVYEYPACGATRASCTRCPGSQRRVHRRIQDALLRSHRNLNPAASSLPAFAEFHDSSRTRPLMKSRRYEVGLMILSASPSARVLRP